MQIDSVTYSGALRSTIAPELTSKSSEKMLTQNWQIRIYERGGLDSQSPF